MTVFAECMQILHEMNPHFREKNRPKNKKNGLDFEKNGPRNEKNRPDLEKQGLENEIHGRVFEMNPLFF